MGLLSGIKFRKRLSFGPLKFNFTQKGFSSFSVKVGPWTWNSRTKRHSVDLPGAFSWQSKTGAKEPAAPSRQVEA